MITLDQQTLAARTLRELTVLASLTVAPHFLVFDLRITLAMLAVLGWRLVAAYRPALLPGRGLRILLTLAAAGLVVSVYPLLIGLQAKLALLSLMLLMKLLECRSRRDLMLVVFLCYFTLVTHFLLEQSPGLVLYVLLVVVALTAQLVNHARHRPLVQPWRAYRSATVLLLQALPVMIALFFLFPRFAGPLWNLGLDNSTGKTGLSDRIEPGSISNLIRSRAVAFRVDFDSAAPPPRQRYWRGPVLWQTDGYRWNRAPYLQPGEVTYQSRGEPVVYQVTLEPSNHDWLFALDLPAKLPPDATLRPDFQLLGKGIKHRRYRYQMTSQLDYNTGALSERERQLGLQLPANITPRMRQLVSQWQQPADGDAALVNRALTYFREQPFYYTLNPPQVLTNPADQFLFDTRRGFCEHYATSFTLLMRLGGIPARVVTGYQGGEINPMGDYLIVRQSDAHAWSEVWLQGRGWVRIDPTAAVAPTRIEQPFDYALDENLGEGAPLVFQLGDRSLLSGALRQLRLGIDAANAGWHRWVLGYSQEQQRRLLAQLGMEKLSLIQLALGMGVVVMLLLAGLMIGLRRLGRQPVDPLLRLYQRFCQRLARIGIVRPGYEGPLDFARRIRRRRPDLAPAAEQILERYTRLRYGGADTPAQRRALQRMIRRFKT